MYYVTHNSHETEAAMLYSRYQAESHYQVEASIIKGWMKPARISVTRESPSIIFPDSIPDSFFRLQELSAADVWDNPENDAWDELYRTIDG